MTAALNRLFGATRWVHNEYIARARASYEAGHGHLSGYTGQRLVVTDGRANPETAWLKEFPSGVFRGSVTRAATGHQSFIASTSGRRNGPRLGRPRSKKKTARQSAEFPRAAFSIRGGWENTRAHGVGQLKLSKIGPVDSHDHA
ncbi:transposase IS605 [Microcella alkaliphila]|uniref:Transposase IS605 n=1 Tax=Microcella alkaliphila TaxID=279828 RepID=A0A0U5BFY1_9MICO|nr:transposase IS605 [Microcella alkaliphila]